MEKKINTTILFQKSKIDERIEQCSCKVAIEREKFKAVSNTVWVCWKTMI